MHLAPHMPAEVGPPRPIRRTGRFIRRYCSIGLLAVSVSWASADAPEQMQFADGLFSRGLYDLALEEYQKLVSDPMAAAQRDTVLFRLAECHRELGAKRAAEQAYRQILEGHPDSPYRFRAEFRRAELFVAGAQYAEAEQLFRALVEQSPPDSLLAAGRYFLGYCLERLGQAAEAEGEYRAVVEELPDTPYASYAALAAAQLLQDQDGRAAEARAFLERASGHSATPRVAAEALFLRGDTAYRAGDYAAAARAYRELLETYPQDRRAREAQLQAAWSYHHDGSDAEAMRMADRALGEAFVDARAEWLYLVANCHRHQGRSRDAVEVYDQILAEFPNHALRGAAGYERLLVFFNLGDYAQVIASAAGLEPGPAFAEDLYWLRVESHIGLHQREEARSALAELVERFPATRRAPVALFRLARMEQDAARFDGAALLYQRVADRFAEDALAAEALFAAAYCRVMEGDYAAALKDWNRLVKDFSAFQRMEDALYQKALTELKLEDDAAGEATLRQLIQAYPAGALAAEAAYWVGVLREKRGDHAAAERELRRVLELNPSDELAQRTRYRLSGVLQVLQRPDEAAELLQGLLPTPLRAEIAPALLEWLARHRLQQQAHAKALAAATSLADEENPVWKQIGHCLAGRAAEALEQTDEARQAYQAAVDQSAQTQEGILAALRLGELSLAEDLHDDAERFYTMAVERAVDDDQASNRARGYFGLGDVARAREDWAEAARRYMSVGILFDDEELTPEALYRAVDAFTRQQRLRERSRTADELKSRYPDSPWTRKLEEEQ